MELFVKRITFLIAVGKIMDLNGTYINILFENVIKIEN